MLSLVVLSTHLQRLAVHVVSAQLSGRLRSSACKRTCSAGAGRPCAPQLQQRAPCPAPPAAAPEAQGISTRLEACTQPLDHSLLLLIAAHCSS